MANRAKFHYLPLLFILLALVVIGVSIKFRYGECKKVGHSTLYCVLDLGR